MRSVVILNQPSMKTAHWSAKVFQLLLIYKSPGLTLIIWCPHFLSTVYDCSASVGPGQLVETEDCFPAENRCTLLLLDARWKRKRAFWEFGLWAPGSTLCLCGWFQSHLSDSHCFSTDIKKGGFWKPCILLLPNSAWALVSCACGSSPCRLC